MSASSFPILMIYGGEQRHMYELFIVICVTAEMELLTGPLSQWPLNQVEELGSRLQGMSL